MGFLDIFKSGRKSASKSNEEPSSELLPEPSLMEDPYPEQICTSDSGADSTPCPIIQESPDIGGANSDFNFQDIPLIDERCNSLKRYLLYGENQIKAEMNVAFVLDIINTTIEEKSIPIDFELKSRMCFSCENYGNGTIDFSFIKITPFTPSGRNSKYPIVLYICNGDDFINGDAKGEIYYLQDGTIGKARIFIWKNRVCYTFHCTVKCQKFVVTKVEKMSSFDSVRITIFKL